MYVYIIRNLINSKVYVGQTKTPSQRKACHFYLGRKGDKRPLYASMRKHGAENFTFEILEECADKVINERETHWVTHFDSFNPEKGYNLTKGGQFEYTPEVRQKMRDNHVGLTGKHHTEEARRKIGEGNRKSLSGRKLSDEHRANISKNHSRHNAGKITSEETRSKIRASLQGKSPSEETRQKMSQAHKGKINHAGIAASLKARVAKANERYAHIIELLSKGTSTQDLITIHGFSPSTIARAKRKMS